MSRAPNQKTAVSSSDEDTLLTTHELAARWKLSESRLMNQRSAQTGCRYIKIGNTVRYKLSEVIAYERESW